MTYSDLDCDEASPDYWCGVENGEKEERELIFKTLREYLKDKPKAVVGEDSGEWIIEGIEKLLKED